VTSVILGDHRGLVLPDMGRQRGGLIRLKGIRLVHTHLTDEGLTQDDLNDLALLRLDMIAALIVGPDGLPRRIEASHLLPANAGGETLARYSATTVAGLDLDFAAQIRSLEEELTRTQNAARQTDSKDRALLVSVSALPRAEAEDHLAEMEELAHTAGLETLDKVLFRRRQGTGRFLSRERLSELIIRAFQLGADLIVFAQDISPTEINWLSKQSELRIIDRTQLILDIFAQRARSREGKIQVEMAQLNYVYPRLVKKDTALSRLAGGIGGRGPGETRLEIDRRRVRERIDRLKKDLDRIKAQRARHRDRREREGLPIVSIIGYTNAGKSTLLNNMTRSQVLAEDRLFATLDPTSRRLRFPRDRAIIITDTVGFIRDLPPDLFDAFAATLEELSSADLLLHLVDVSNPRFEDQMRAVNRVLAKLELNQTPTLLVLNKTDRVPAEVAAGVARRLGAVSVSALDPGTFPALIAELEQRLPWPEDR